MARVLTFAGFLMTAEEWNSLDESARLDYLEAFIATGPLRADDWAYESYELSFEPVPGDQGDRDGAVSEW